MKRLIAIIAATFVAAGAFAQGKIETHEIHSNILGVDQNYNVYLPGGYNPEQHYPLAAARTLRRLYRLEGPRPDGLGCK